MKVLSPEGRAPTNLAYLWPLPRVGRGVLLDDAAWAGSKARYHAVICWLPLNPVVLVSIAFQLSCSGSTCHCRRLTSVRVPCSLVINQSVVFLEDVLVESRGLLGTFGLGLRRHGAALADNTGGTMVGRGCAWTTRSTHRTRGLSETR